MSERIEEIRRWNADRAEQAKYGDADKFAVEDISYLLHRVEELGAYIKLIEAENEILRDSNQSD